MKYVFAITATLFYLLAFGGCVLAKTSVGEIQGMLLLIAGTLFFVGAGVIEAIDSLKKQTRPPIPPK